MEWLHVGCSKITFSIFFVITRFQFAALAIGHSGTARFFFFFATAYLNFKMPRRPTISQSSKMRKKRAAARAAKEANQPPPEPFVPGIPTTTVLNPPPAPMPTLPADPLPSNLGEWDAGALLLLKRLGKRDAKTREKALSDLRKLIPDVPDGEGQPFLDRFSLIFPALFKDGSYKVRIAALETAAECVMKFKNKMKTTLPKIVPAWVAARSDPYREVSKSAVHTLNIAFVEPRKRTALAAFTGAALRDFCWDQFGVLYDCENIESFKETAARICGVISWTVEVTQNAGDIGKQVAEFVDDTRRPLVLIAMGIHTSKNVMLSAPEAIVDAGIALLRSCDASKASHEQLMRAESFAEIILATLKRHPDVWSLLLVMFDRCWGVGAFGWGLPGLEDALVSAISSHTPPPVDGFLPLFERLPKHPSTMKIVSRVLCVLRAMLGVDGGQNEGGNPRESVPLNYTLVVAPAYMECVRYVFTAGITDWSNHQDPSIIEKHILEERSKLAQEHIAPFAGALFVASILPLPVSKKRSTIDRKARSALRNNRDKRDARVVRALASTLAVLDERSAAETILDTPAAFLGALGGGNHSAVQLAERYAALLRGMPNSPWARTLASAVVTQIVNPVEAAIMPAAADEAPIALLRVLSDSVQAVPKLIISGRPKLREECALYAVKRADKDPAAAGAVLSWATWSPETTAVVGANAMTEKLSEEFGDDLRVSFATIASMIKSHADNKWEAQSGIESWIPFSGIGLETIAALAARQVQVRGEYMEDALLLVTEILRPVGGTKMRDAIHQGALLAISDCLRKEDVDVHECVDAVLREYSATKDGELSIPERLLPFVAAAVAYSEKLSSATVAFLKNRAGAVSREYSEMILDEMEAMLLKPTGKESTREEILLRSAEVWRQTVEALAGEDEMKAVELHGAFLKRFTGDKESIGLPTELLEYLLTEVAPEVLFGGVNETPFEPSVFVSSYRLLKQRSTKAAMLGSLDMEDHVGILPVPIRVSLAEEIVGELFRAQDRNLLDILGSVVQPIDGAGEDESFLSPIEAAIAKLVLDAADRQKKVTDVGLCVLSVEVVEVTTALSKRRILSSFEEVLTMVSKSLRSDASTNRAQFAARLLSAALVTHKDILMSIPEWLVKIVNTSLRAVRQFHGNLRYYHKPDATEKEKKQVKSNTLAVGAVLLSRAIEAFGVEKISEDEWRFWPYAVQNALLDAQYIDAIHNRGTQCAVTTLAALAVQLVRAQEASLVRKELKLEDDGSTLPVRIESDIMCRNGAWSAVNFLGALENDKDDSLLEILPVDSDALAQLIIMASERNVLLPNDGELPLSVEKVYAMLPMLASPKNDVRRAVAKIVTRSASEVLPKTIARQFPRNGFDSESHELKFAENMIPKPLRDCLQNPGEEELDLEEDLEEIGYFLGWQIFLELIKQPVGSVVNESGENISFRRMGLTYLRENESIFETFFAKCARIVVQGSSEEKKWATDAAISILENASLGSKLQGMQLAKDMNRRKESRRKSSSADDEEELESDEMMLDKQVVEAAGASFALALQRLPALSRQNGTDKLTHGTARATESFVEERISKMLIAGEIDRMRAWGTFETTSITGASGREEDRMVSARGSVAGREVVAVYSYSDVSLEIALKLPACYPLQVVEVEPKSGLGMSKAKWEKTVRSMSTVLRFQDGSVVEAVELWRRNLDKAFEGAEECPICYSVLNLNTMTVPKKKCRTCKNLFHSECLCRWFRKSNSANCPLCRSVF